MKNNATYQAIEQVLNRKTAVYELNEKCFVYGETKDFESVDQFIQIATKEQADEDTYIADVRITECVMAMEGLPSCVLRPVSEAFLEYFDCYVGELKDKE